MRQGDPSLMISHGMCSSCLGEASGIHVEDLGGVDSSVLETLPVGVVRLDAQGTILAYNRQESARFGHKTAEVIGRSFFDDIAPCSSVQEFRGRFEELTKTNTPGRARLEFIFCYQEETQLVRIVMLWDAKKETGHLLISTPQN